MKTCTDIVCIRPLATKLFSFLFLSLVFLLVTSLATSAQSNSAVSLNGTNEYIDCGSAIPATNIRTMEAWVKFNSLSGTQEIISKSTSGLGIEILVYNSNLAFFCMSASGTSHVDYAISNLSTGIWYHVAASWDGTDRTTMRLYLNGIPVGTRSDVGTIAGGVANPAGSFMIGNWADGGRYLNGIADEVRVWNTVRTPSELKTSMYLGVAGNTAGLMAYYKMNEASGTTLTDETPNANTGTFVGPVTRASSPVEYGSNALDFDGNNDCVNVPTSSNYDLTSGTIECWVKANTLDATNYCFLANRAGAASRYSFHMRQDALGFWNGTTFRTIPSPGSVNFVAGQWYHFAFVGNGATVDAYVNGAYLGTYAGTFGGATGLPLVIGKSDVANVGGESFPGAVDEVRIWSTQRTASEILNNRDLNLTGSEAGLVGLFNFNQGIVNSDNTGLEIVIDQTSNNNHGKVTNMALTGVASNYVSTAAVLPVKLTGFDVYKDGTVVKLKWQTSFEQNADKFIIERSINAKDFINIGSVTCAGNSSVKTDYSFTDNSPATGKNAYRLKQLDLDGRSTYSPIKQVQVASQSRLTWTGYGNQRFDVRLENGSNEPFVLVDGNGRLIKTGRLVNGRFSFTGLKSGTYIFRLPVDKNQSIKIVI